MGAAETYAYGFACTWHGPATFATLKPEPTGAVFYCPHCGLPLKVATSDEFWSGVKLCDRQEPGYEAMMRWSEGKCFPDFDTMQNAYRQGMEQ